MGTLGFSDNWPCLEGTQTQIWILNLKKQRCYGCFEYFKFAPSVNFMKKKKEKVKLRIFSRN